MLDGLRAMVSGLLLCVAAASPAQPERLVDGVEAAVLGEHLGQAWGAAAVRRGDAKSVMGFGLRDAASLDRIDGDHLFDVGSITKVITALTVMSLVEDGVLSLGGRVRDYAPSVPAEAAAVTLEQLLSHTAGLDDQRAMQRLDFPDRDEAVRRALAAPRLFEPGGGWRYSNAGFVVLAAVIEHATGEPYERVARERVLVPAGMVGSGFLDGADALGRPLDPGRFTARRIESPGAPALRRGLLEDGYGWGLRGAGGLLTSARDLLRLDDALRSGAIIDAGTLAGMHEPRRAACGLAWFTSPASHGSAMISHGGSTRGFTASFRRYPDEDACVIVLTNTRRRAHELAAEIESELFRDRQPEVSAVMRVAGLEMNEYRLATLEDPGIEVRTVEGAIVLGFTSAGQVRAEISLNRVAAEIAARSISSLRDSGDPPGEQDGTTLKLAMLPYTPDADSAIAFEPGELELAVMPRYSGRTADGRPLVDERVFVRLEDARRSFWPVLVSFGDADAARLARELAEAAGELVPPRGVGD